MPLTPYQILQVQKQQAVLMRQTLGQAKRLPSELSNSKGTNYPIFTQVKKVGGVIVATPMVFAFTDKALAVAKESISTATSIDRKEIVLSQIRELGIYFSKSRFSGEAGEDFSANLSEKVEQKGISNATLELGDMAESAGIAFTIGEATLAVLSLGIYVSALVMIYEGFEAGKKDYARFEKYRIATDKILGIKPKGLKLTGEKVIEGMASFDNQLIGFANAAPQLLNELSAKVGITNKKIPTLSKFKDIYTLQINGKTLSQSASAKWLKTTSADMVSQVVENHKLSAEIQRPQYRFLTTLLTNIGFVSSPPQTLAGMGLILLNAILPSKKFVDFPAMLSSMRQESLEKLTKVADYYESPSGFFSANYSGIFVFNRAIWGILNKRVKVSSNCFIIQNLKQTKATWLKFIGQKGYNSLTNLIEKASQKQSVLLYNIIPEIIVLTGNMYFTPNTQGVVVRNGVKYWKGNPNFRTFNANNLVLFGLLNELGVLSQNRGLVSSAISGAGAESESANFTGLVDFIKDINQQSIKSISDSLR